MNDEELLGHMDVGPGGRPSLLGDLDKENQAFKDKLLKR